MIVPIPWVFSRARKEQSLHRGVTGRPGIQSEDRGVVTLGCSLLEAVSWVMKELLAVT